MANEQPAPGQPVRDGASPASAGAAEEAPVPAAEPRAVRRDSVRDLIFKHANDRRTLDRVLARMRCR